MSKVIGRNARILLGNRNISPDVNQATLTINAEAPEVTAFCDDYRQRLQDGVRDFELSVDGFYNDSASKMDEILSAALAASALGAAYFTGLAGCQIGREFMSIETKYDMKNAVADAATVSFTLSGSSSIYHMESLSGSYLDPLCKTPLVFGTGSSVMGSVDVGGATQTAISSFLSFRVFTLTGTDPTFTAEVEYSANDSSWSAACSVSSITPAMLHADAASLIRLSSASRYARLTVTLGGTSPCAVFLVSAGSIIA